MQLLAFKIKNFRSIIDTGWVNFSTDNITVLVGQNESGKTAVLSALAYTFSGKNISADDTRYGEDYPEILLKTRFSRKEIEEALTYVKNDIARSEILSELIDKDGRIDWIFSPQPDPNKPGKFLKHYELTYPNLNEILDALSLAQTVTPNGVSLDTSTLSFEECKEGLYQAAPYINLFNESSGLLPNKIDIDDDFTLAGVAGYTAASNFLSAAGINLKSLVSSDTRGRAATLEKANSTLTRDFLVFWSQTIGKSSKIKFECSINQHPVGHEKVGKPYLEFMVYDSSGPFYPQQRSRGTRWFISFYLQMRSSESDSDSSIFLLDEPGANLHEKAQSDVLSLLEKISSKVGIVYSTHNPHLISEKALYRVIAVERDDKNPMHPTKLIGAHALGAASSDTLSPIFNVMGSNWSKQTSIKNKNNVILEELSAYYYFQAFWRLLKFDHEVNFLPATGTSNVKVFANLLLGWGLDFVVVLDDEPSGRAVFNSLKRDMFLEDDIWAKKRMYKISGCEGIEDIFTADDYKNHILKDPLVALTQGNSKWAKNHGAAKAMHALKFLQSVQAEELTLNDFHVDSRTKIGEVAGEVLQRLQQYSH